MNNTRRTREDAAVQVMVEGSFGSLVTETGRQLGPEHLEYVYGLQSNVVKWLESITKEIHRLEAIQSQREEAA